MAPVTTPPCDPNFHKVYDYDIKADVCIPDAPPVAPLTTPAATTPAAAAPAAAAPAATAPAATAPAATAPAATAPAATTPAATTPAAATPAAMTAAPPVPPPPQGQKSAAAARVPAAAAQASKSEAVSDLGVTVAFVRNGCRIDAVLSGSAAEKMGLHTGDIILTIDGDRPKTTGAVATLAMPPVPGEEPEIKIRRNMQDVTLVVGPLGSLGVHQSRVSKTEQVRAITQDQTGESHGENHGVVVGVVGKDSAASKAGLESGDVIMTAAGTDIIDPQQLGPFFDQGAKLSVKRPTRVSVTIDLAETTELGARAQAVSEQTAVDLQRSSSQGAVVLEISTEMPATRGLQVGDIILSINGDPIADTGDLEKAIAKAVADAGGQLEIEVIRYENKEVDTKQRFKHGAARSQSAKAV